MAAIPDKFFSSGCPAGLRMPGVLDDLEKLCRNGGNAIVPDLCLIGLIAHAEAYFKDTFATLLNIFPDLSERLQSAGIDILVSPVDLYAYEHPMQSLGFVISERLNFSRARDVNNYFSHLIKQSPFSKAELALYDKIKNDRNMLVHHGGAQTNKFLRQQMKIGGTRMRPYKERIQVSEDSVLSDIATVKAIAKKLAASCHKSGLAILKERAVPEDSEVSRAVNWLAWIEDSEIAA